MIRRYLIDTLNMNRFEMMEMKQMDDKFTVSGDQNESERSKVIFELQKAIDQGLSSGPAIPFDPKLFKRKMREARN